MKETEVVDLSPPPMGATESWLHWEPPQQQAKRSKKLEFDKSSNESTFRTFTVQLFPQRLINFLEQAERYARAAFLPSPERVPRRLTFLWSSSTPPPVKQETTSSPDFLSSSSKRTTFIESNSSKNNKLLLAEVHVSSKLDDDTDDPLLSDTDDLVVTEYAGDIKR